MLVFTNRAIAAASDPSAFQRSFTPGGNRISVASVARDGAGRWALSKLDDDVTERDAFDRLLPLFGGARPLLLYLHDQGTAPAACFARCAALEAEYGVEVIGFSWPAEGLLCDGQPLPGLAAPDAPVEELELAGLKGGNRVDGTGQQLARRYRQAKVNAQESVDGLARLLRMLATCRLISNAQPFTVAAHGLGAHLLQYALEVPGASEALGAAHNVVLLAPCVRADGHRGWIHQLRPKGRTYVTFNRADTVLAGAFIADGRKQAKLGVEPGALPLQGAGFRYISFSNAHTGPCGHRYFVDGLTGESRRLFGRLFRSEADLQPGEPERKAYPAGCEAGVGYMALPEGARGGEG
ncbi:alpha/beta hydrolase [Ramlibacter alkalitolerans]|uniref:Alpha/beta hydrolase n=1 Tax=Ramlibacter alkalitolerans TaxID=2039631 RepID=A0ABS1JVX5_9BURK|nr:alpha/beta hydrolase [Ramlibacter alkalitolerans]MBL0428418.1 alpha/beta hydrolase [Ramlibacter alkalitolerans]